MIARRLHRRIRGLSTATVLAAEESLAGKRRGLTAFLPFLGPAVIASIAYMDPGNFATNIQAGAHFGYTLLWVVVLSNIIAMLFQSLSAKLGIVTGKSLATHCREQFSRPVVYFMWAGSEVAAMATDLAEFIGAAIGLSLLFHLPLMVSLAIVGVVVYGILLVEGYGFRPMEILIAGFVSLIGISYLAEIVISDPAWGALAHGAVVPHLPGGALLLAVGIVGATVMPHAIYLHSTLTRGRVKVANDADRRRVIGYSNREVLVALGMAGLVNMAMVAMAAAVFHASGHQGVATIEVAYKTLEPLLGISAAGIFLLSLLASGISSSVVGTMAGQTIMQDFVGLKIPLIVRRLITMAPAFIVMILGMDPTTALVVSQVVLSIMLPLPVVALILFTSRADIMGSFANSRPIAWVALCCGGLVLLLNALLLMELFGGGSFFV